MDNLQQKLLEGNYPGVSGYWSSSLNENTDYTDLNKKYASILSNISKWLRTAWRIELDTLSQTNKQLFLW